MSAKMNVPKKKNEEEGAKRGQPKPLPAPLNREEDSLLPYQKLACDLAEVRIRNQAVEAWAHFDALFWMQYRAIALCDIVQEMATSKSPNATPRDALATAMGIIREDIEVAQWILRKMPRPVIDRLSRASGCAV